MHARNLVAVAALLCACGDAPGTSPGHQAGSLRLAVTADPPAPVAGERVSWVLTVSNGGPGPVTLRFTSGKQGDVVLRRQGAGDEAYRWSEGRLFTQATSTLQVGPGEQQVLRLDESALRVEPGNYDVEASLASTPAPDSTRSTVRVSG